MLRKPILLAVCAALAAGCSESSSPTATQAPSGPPNGFVPKKKDSGINPIGINVSIMAPPMAYSTPQEAYDAFVAAVESDQLRLAADVFTPTTQTAVAGSLAFRLSLGASEGNYKTEKVARLFDIHGLNDDESEIEAEDNGAASMMRSIGKTVRYRSVFIVRATRLLREMEMDAGAFFDCGSLEELKVIEDRATATLVVNEEDSRALEFHRIGGAWMVHIPDQMFEQ